MTSKLFLGWQSACAYWAFAVFFLSVQSIAPAFAQTNGSWNVDASGTWSASSNWLNGIIADGSNSTANFTNSISSVTTVTLDSSRSIGGLNFSGAASTDSAWILSGSSILTLSASGTPSITTDTTTTISVQLAGTNGFTKSGFEVLILTGANTYSGVTTISSTLRAVDGIGLSMGSNLTLAGGVLESSGTFSRGLGINAGQVKWTDDGGFAAQGGNLVVRLNGNTNAVTWGSGNFVPTGSPLLLNSRTADALVDFQNAIDLGGATRTVSVTDNTATTADLAQLSGVLSNGGLTKSGSGTLVLNGANTYSGTTMISAGLLRAIDGVGLPTGSNLMLAGGVLESSGTFNRTLGTAAGQVRWTAGGGFAAQGGNLVVQLNGNTNTITWGSGSFVPSTFSLAFGSVTADALVELQNAIDLGGGTRTVNVADNSGTTTDAAQLSGVLSNGALIKVGSGTLVLSGANTYSFSTTISAGTLRLSGGDNRLLNTGNILVSGGTLDLSTTNQFAATVQLSNGTITGLGTLTATAYDLRNGTITSTLAGINGVAKTGTGTVILGGANTYSGVTTISAGTLRAADGVGLPTASNLTLAGGVLEASGTFSRSLGTGAGQVQWTADGGFAGQGGSLVLQLNGNTNVVTWGSGNFVPAGASLILGTSVDLQNAIDFGGATRTVSATAGSSQLSGALGNGGLTKSGSGTLVLNGANTYGGVTTISSGTLRATDGVGLPMTSNLTLAGGVLETSGTFSRSLGTGPGQVQWVTDGGFTNQGGNLVVQLNGNTNVVTWGSGSFVPAGSSLLLGASSLVDLQNAIDLGGATRTVSATFGTPQLSGVLSNGGLAKSGSGTLILSGANTYSGVTTISAGALRAADGIGLPTASNLTIAGGVLETSGTFGRSLGTSAGQVQWTASGGFAAKGGNLEVQLNSNTNVVTWGSGNFVPSGSSLLLGSITADALVDFQNAIDLGGATRIVTVTDASVRTTDLAQLSGVLSNGGLTKSGSGTLVLSGANTYSGVTTIATGGALRAIDGVGLPTGSNLMLAGGVLESSGTFTRSLGAGAGQVRWSIVSSGGFAAQEGNLVVRLNGNSNVVTWENGNFVPEGFALVMGSVTADALVDFQNAIDLGGAMRSVSVTDNTGTTADVAQLSGMLSNGGLFKSGAGTLVLTAANTYSGVTSIIAGALRAVDGVGLPTASNLVLNGGLLETSGTFSRSLGTGPSQVRWNSGGGFAAQGGNLVVRLNGNTNAVTWGSGNFVAAGSSLILSSVTAEALVDFQNAIDLGGATHTIAVNDNTSTTADLAQLSGALSNGGLTKTGSGTLVLTGANTYSDATTISTGTLRAVDGVGLPTVSNLSLAGGVLESSGTFSRSLGTGIGQVQWTVSGGFSAQGGNLEVQLNGNTDRVTWGSGNFVPAGSTLFLGSLTANAQVDLRNAIDLGGATRTISARDNISSSTDSAQLSGVISNGGLAKTGSGTLILSGANTYSGTTDVNAGTLSVTGSTGSGKTTIATSGLLNGTGTVAGTLEVSSGGALSAGLGNGVKSNGVGRLNSTAAGGTTVEWKTDANVVFDFSAANTSTAAESTPGTNWDYLSITGVLDLQPGLGKINLYINSWNGTTGYGQNSNSLPADNFDKNNAVVVGNVQGRDYSYVWLWATTGGTIMVDGADITGPTDLSDRFNVITDQFSAAYGNGVFSGSTSYTPNSLGGQFWVSAVGNKLFINYSSVPEPSSLLLIGAPGFGLGVCRRRRNRQASRVAEATITLKGESIPE